MDMGRFNLFMKMLEHEYRLDHSELQKISQRLLADGREFENVWKIYRTKSPLNRQGVDEFRPILMELLYS